MWHNVTCVTHWGLCSQWLVVDTLPLGRTQWMGNGHQIQYIFYKLSNWIDNLLVSCHGCINPNVTLYSVTDMTMWPALFVLRGLHWTVSSEKETLPGKMWSLSDKFRTLPHKFHVKLHNIIFRKNMILKHLPDHIFSVYCLIIIAQHSIYLTTCLQIPKDLVGYVLFFRCMGGPKHCLVARLPVGTKHWQDNESQVSSGRRLVSKWPQDMTIENWFSSVDFFSPESKM